MDRIQGGWLSLNTSIFTPTGSRFAELFRSGDEILTMTGPGTFQSAKIASIEKKEYEGPLTTVKTGGHTITASADTLFYAAFLSGSCHCGMGLLAEVGSTTLVCPIRDPRSLTTMTGFRRGWIIAICDSIEELIYNCYLESLRFGIPFADFTSRKIQNLSVIERACAGIDIKSRAQTMLNSLGMDRDFPHLTNYGNLGLKPLNLTMFGDSQSKSGSTQHRLNLEDGSRSRIPVRENSRFDRLAPASLEKLRIPGSDPEKWEMWNVDVSKDEYSELLLLARTFASLDTIRIVEKGIMGPGQVYVRFPAANLNCLMAAPCFTSGQITRKAIDSAEKSNYSGPLMRIVPDSDFPIIAGGTPIYIEKEI